MGQSEFTCADRVDTLRRNLEALASRDPALAQTLTAFSPAVRYCMTESAGGEITIEATTADERRTIEERVSRALATAIARKLYPAGKCTEPLLIAGLDRGWLWTTAYALECSTPRTPGHRPPLYFLCRDLERFWLNLHLHDWSAMLTDQRVQLFVGSDPVQRCATFMEQRADLPWPKLSVTVDQLIWPAGITIDSLWQNAHQASNAQMQKLLARIDSVYGTADTRSQIRKLRGERLRVMGITSHFTTFLKYSMRDWLDAFAAMGHETRLVMEEADCQIANPLRFAQEVDAFQPDLLLMIDHYRAEIAGLPKQIPCVMWVQDYLPSIFSNHAGSAQGPRDYCVGFGKLELGQRHGYPQERFLPAQVGVNEKRFSPISSESSELDLYRCDVSFVSHASAPATALLTEQLKNADTAGRKLMIDVFEQLRAIYDSGECVTQPRLISGMIEAAVGKLRTTLDATLKRNLLDFFTHRINNAMFRHQALSWAAERDLDLRIYGRGWDRHPRFARFAHGVACNESALRAIYQASKVNLQLTPFGAAHQRLFEGLAAGGFFLIRYVPGDVIERVYRELLRWCQENDLHDDEAIQRAATPVCRQLISEIERLSNVDPFTSEWKLTDMLKLSADGNYIRSAGTIWDENFDRVAFMSAAELHAKLDTYLADSDGRSSIAAEMRLEVLKRFTYEKTSARLLDFIADDLAANAYPNRAVA